MLSGLDSHFPTIVYKFTREQTIFCVRGLYMGHQCWHDYSNITTESQILGKCKGNPEKALFYIKKTLENNWSRAVLMNFLDTDLYERQGKAITNFSITLPEEQSELAQAITKDPYNFDFISISEKYNEKELKYALLDNIEKFFIELGSGFAYVGREVELNIGKQRTL